MDIDDFNKEINNPSFDIALEKVIIENYKLAQLNNGYLIALLELQLEIRDLLRGKTSSEIDEYIQDKMEEVERNINKFANDKILEDFSNKFIK